jgi:alkylation response protein AidB-like acyl-CoA dehydrogenase
MSLDFHLSDDQQSIRQLAREFAEAEIKPHAIEWDEGQIFPMETLKKMAALGFLGIMVPPELGGAGLGALENAIIIEEIARACPGVALSVAAHNGLCTGHILAFGSEATKSKRLAEAVQWMSEGKPRLWKYMKEYK